MLLSKLEQGRNRFRRRKPARRVFTVLKGPDRREDPLGKGPGQYALPIQRKPIRNNLYSRKNFSK
jgi:hypothetical protein